MRVLDKERLIIQFDSKEEIEEISRALQSAAAVQDGWSCFWADEDPDLSDKYETSEQYYEERLQLLEDLSGIKVER